MHLHLYDFTIFSERVCNHVDSSWFVWTCDASEKCFMTIHQTDLGVLVASLIPSFRLAVQELPNSAIS